MRPLSTTLITTAALGAALAPAASADTLVAEAPGARNLVSGGGYLAWSAPSADGWRLTVRAPDGTVSQPAVAPFAQPPQPGIGTTDQFGPSRRLVAVYTRNGDVYELDLRTGTETGTPACRPPRPRRSSPSTSASTSSLAAGGACTPSRAPAALGA